MDLCSHISSISKRSLYAGFFVWLAACQPATETATNKLNSDSANQVDRLSTAKSCTALLTLSELFGADDVQEGIKRAVQNKDNKALLFWQEQLLNAGKEVCLSQRDLNIISGEQGLMFIEFEAKKQLFHEEFVLRLVNFEKIDDLVSKYPFLKHLHQRAYNLISERDDAVQRAAKMLREEGFSGDAMQEARLRWVNFMQASDEMLKLK